MPPLRAPSPPASLFWVGGGTSPPPPPPRDHVVPGQSGVDSITALDVEAVGVARIDWVSFPSPSPQRFLRGDPGYALAPLKGALQRSESANRTTDAMTIALIMMHYVDHDVLR